MRSRERAAAEVGALIAYANNKAFPIDIVSFFYSFGVTQKVHVTNLVYFHD